MMKLRAEIFKDSNGRLDKLKVFKGRPRRGIELQFIYGDDGFVSNIEFKGRRQDMPSIPDIIDLVNEKFMERIGTIGQIDTIEEIINVNVATRQNFREGFQFVEHWETGKFDKTKYFGRTGSFFVSERELPLKDWHTPIFARGVNTLEAGWVEHANAIHLRNSLDGLNVDHVYFAPSQTFKRCMMRVDAKIPDPAGLAAGTIAGFGFESIAEGYWSIAWLNFGNALGQAALVSQAPQIEGNALASNTENVTINNPDVWARYLLILDPPYLKFYQPAAADPTGHPRLTDTMVISKKPAYLPHFWCPFFCNESSSIISEYYVGRFAITRLELSRFPSLVINEANIAAAGERHFDLYLCDEEAIAVSLKQVFPAGTTDGVRCYLLASGSYDFPSDIDTENVDDAFTYFEPKFAANETHQKTVNVDCAAKYLRILVRNLDAANAQGACKLWVTRR